MFNGAEGFIPNYDYSNRKKFDEEMDEAEVQKLNDWKQRDAKMDEQLEDINNLLDQINEQAEEQQEVKKLV